MEEARGKAHKEIASAHPDETLSRATERHLKHDQHNMLQGVGLPVMGSRDASHSRLVNVQ